MKEKLKVFLLIIMFFIYMLCCFRNAHNEFINGISKEEEMREERLIW